MKLNNFQIEYIFHESANPTNKERELKIRYDYKDHRPKKIEMPNVRVSSFKDKAKISVLSKKQEFFVRCQNTTVGKFFVNSNLPFNFLPIVLMWS